MEEVIIFVPNYNENQCIEIINSDTIRVFDDISSYIFKDYYINSHYIYKTGIIDETYIKNCSSLKFTDNQIYRNDLPECLFITLCISSLFLLPYILLKRFRKR